MDKGAESEVADGAEVEAEGMYNNALSVIYIASTGMGRANSPVCGFTGRGASEGGRNKEESSCGRCRKGQGHGPAEREE